MVTVFNVNKLIKVACVKSEWYTSCAIWNVKIVSPANNKCAVLRCSTYKHCYEPERGLTPKKKIIRVC